VYDPTLPLLMHEQSLKEISVPKRLMLELYLTSHK
jgi:hypothetical protein